jgi:methenyltetrahydromethanopterin cyclohydrolase
MMEKSLSMNRLASKILRKLLQNPAYFGVKIRRTDSGATIVDAGIEANGGFETGRLVTEICMGGCGKAEISYRRYGDFEIPSIFVCTDHPVIATLGSQYAGWQVKEKGYFAIGSGPARALAQKPKKIFEEVRYKDSFESGVLVLETNKQPPNELLEKIAEDCKIKLEDLTVILTPTTSVVGATQVAGRIVETGIHRFKKVGLDPNIILHAYGFAPIPPIAPTFAEAMARSNDAILYGGTAGYLVRHSDEEELKHIAAKATSKASRQYGKPFIEIFKDAKYDFYKIDSNLFAPAKIEITNLETGNTFVSGEIDSEILGKSLGFKVM